LALFSLDTAVITIGTETQLLERANRFLGIMKLMTIWPNQLSRDYRNTPDAVMNIEKEEAQNGRV